MLNLLLLVRAVSQVSKGDNVVKNVKFSCKAGSANQEC